MLHPSIQTYMKATKFTRQRKAVLIAFLITSPLASFAQTGKVWTSIADFNAMGLSINMDKTINSQNPELNTLFQNLQISSIEKAFPASRSRELSIVYEIACNCDENDLLQQVSSKKHFFQNTEIAPTYKTLDTPNDYSTAFTNDYALNLINAEAAWDVTHGDTSIVVAITDENYWINHEELIGKYNYVTPAFTNTNYSHGTAVAITAAGNTNNSLGKSAIGYNSTLQLRTMNYNEVLAASYAGARVINMSWVATCYYSSYSQLLIDEAHANGTILVAAAGNGNTCGGPDNMVYPAAYNHVIAVSCVGPYDNHERIMGNPTTTHQHNSSVDICAPGYDIALSIAPGNYITGTGSSFAAPLVTGTIALMLAVNSCLTCEQVEYILKQTAVNIDQMNVAYVGKLGAGRLDAYAAVEMASKFTTLVNGINGENIVSCSTMEQGISLDLNTVASPYEIEWDNGSNAQTLSDIDPGTYSAIVRDANGCVGYYETVIDTVVPITISADIYPIQCFGENSGHIEIFVAGGYSNYTYEWNNGDTTDYLYNVSAGAYTVIVTDDRGCKKSEEFLMNEPNKLLASITSIIPILNHSGSIDLTVNGGTFPYVFSWNYGATTEDLEDIPTGFYEVLITDAKGCLASANAYIESLERPIFIEDVIVDNAVFEIDGKRNHNLYLDNSLINEIIEVKENGDLVFNIYPNPTFDVATAVWESMEVKTIQVFNVSGEMVKTANVNRLVTQYTLQGLERGEYLVRLVAMNGESVVKKVIFL